jgi:hypothetical protein
LERVEFGQALMPYLQDAAARLAELEGEDFDDGPNAENLRIIEQEIGHAMDKLMAQPDTPPLLSSEAAILAAASRGRSIPSVAASNVQSALSGPHWIGALGRLGKSSELEGWLRSVLTAESDLPLAVWLRQVLSAHGLTPASTPAVLAHLLTVEDTDARLAASVALLAADLPGSLVPALTEGALSVDDRMRDDCLKKLTTFCYGHLATDGSTRVVEWLLHTKRTAKGNAHERTMMDSVIRMFDY